MLVMWLLLKFRVVSLVVLDGGVEPTGGALTFG